MSDPRTVNGLPADYSDPSTWVDSHEAARLLNEHPRHGLFVLVGDVTVPVTNVRYEPDGNYIVIDLLDMAFD